MSDLNRVSANYYTQLVSQIRHESDSNSKKLEILYSSIGQFTPDQVAEILLCYRNAPDRVRALQVLERRLVNMTCQDARKILDTLTASQNDKLVGLDIIKRAILDSHTAVGYQHILNCYPFEGDKQRAASILMTVRHDVVDKLPAGGHQLYGALGYTYTQAPPLLPHMYGSVEDQRLKLPGEGKIAISPQAQSGTVASLYTSHPSYALPTGRNYAEDRLLPGTEGYPKDTEIPNTFPDGAPPTCYHSGAPTAVGYPTLERQQEMSAYIQ